MYWGTPGFISRIYNKFEWNGDRSEKTIYLTFDDGPTEYITSKVLDILDEYNAKATFFCLGRNVDRHRKLYQEILNRGHKTGNHTYSHLKGWKTSTKNYIQDVELASTYIKTNLFRPPYGRIRKNQSRYLLKSYRIIMWDVLTHDYNSRLPRKMCLRNVKRNTNNGSIVVFHDSVKASKNLFYILPRFLEYFSKKGFEFNTF